MAITKEITVDKIEVLEMGQVQIRTATKIIEDGFLQLQNLIVLIHRHVLEPSVKNDDVWQDTDISEEDAKVHRFCNAVWTNEVKTAFQQMRDAQNTIGE